jgi:hypothetical protein
MYCKHNHHPADQKHFKQLRPHQTLPYLFGPLTLYAILAEVEHTLSQDKCYSTVLFPFSPIALLFLSFAFLGFGPNWLNWFGS